MKGRALMFLFPILVIAVCACVQRNLTRSQAAALIRKSSLLNSRQTVSLPLGWLRGHTADPIRDWIGSTGREDRVFEKMIGTFTSLGIIQVGPYRPHQTMLGTVMTEVLISLTPNGQQEMRSLPNLWGKDESNCGLLWISECWEVAIATQDLLQVTGVSDGNGSTATAEFTWHWVLTKYGAYFSDRVERAVPQKAVAHFQLFDDGWRLQR